LTSSSAGASVTFPAGIATRATTKATAIAAKLFSTVPQDFALASRTVFYGMAAAMAVAFVVALAVSVLLNSGPLYL